MKIKDKRKQNKELTEYHVGDVIADNDSVYMIVDQKVEGVGIVNLKTAGLLTFNSLEDMFHSIHDSSDRLVNAYVVIES